MALHGNDKFKKEYVQKMYDYLEECEDTVELQIPTLNQFCRKVDVHISTLHEWKKRHKDFAKACEAMMSLQERLLINYGLFEKGNPAFAKFLLKCNHKYVAEEVRMKLESDKDADKVVIDRLVINTKRDQKSLPKPVRKEKDLGTSDE